MINLERATSNRTVGWPSLVGLLLIPLLLAAGFLWTTWGSSDRLGRVDAAVVNLDEPAEIDGQPVPLGRQLSGGLVEGDPDNPDQNFSWHLSDPDDAAAGLESGRYAAVVTIPEDFSTRATSYAGEADEAEQATLQVETSEITGIADSAVSRTIAETATRSLNTQLTESYLDNIYVGFNDMGEQFQSVADGAGELADGASQLSTGTTEAASGTREFASGLKELSTGTSDLADGTSDLASGATELSTGTKELTTGSGQLATGLEQLSDGVSTLPKDTKALASGASKLSGGVKEVSTGAGQLAGGASELSSGASQYADGVDQYAAGVGTFADGMGTYRDGMATLSKTGLPECPDEVAAGGPQACALFQEGVKAGAQAAVVGLDGDDTEQNPGLVAGAQDLEQGATQLSGGAKELSTGASELSTGAKGLSGGAKELSTGATQLSSGLSQFADEMPTLTNGIAESASGARELATGTSQLSSGTAELATGADQLSTGARQLATGTKEASTGATELSSGMTELSTGARELSQGTTQLADGLAEGAEEIPSYDKQERAQLSSVVASPVTTDVEAAGGVTTGDQEEQSLISQVASTTLLLVLALWVGGLATFLVVQAVPSSTVIDNRSSFRLTLAAVTPAAAIAAVQAVALTTILNVILELSVAKTAGVLGIALLAALTFVALNHALVAWFGGVGRFISVIIGVLTAAGSVVSAVPALFDTVAPFLPTTPALTGVRSVITEGSSTAGSVGLLVAWLIGASVLSILAVSRKRQLNSAEFVRALAA